MSPRTDAGASSRASPIKRRRRTQAEMQALEDGLLSIVRANRPVTVRQTFYLAVAAGLVEKKETEYKHTVGRLLTRMRREELIPYGHIADNSRWIRQPQTFDSVADALRWTAQTYRRSVWSELPVRVEVWSEKDAIAGVLYEETSKWAVPLMVVKGYSSLSYLYEIGQEIQHSGKPTFIYYFGDHDPSGVDAQRFVEEELRGFAGRVPLHFVRAAVTPEQIDSLNLQTRPTKDTDSRSKGFSGASVDVDAIPPRQLRQLARDCIEQHIDHDLIEILETAEESERGTLEMMAGWAS